jgi:hypothetical protein
MSLAKPLPPRKPFWQSKTLWSLLLMIVTTSLPPLAEMIEKKEFKPTKIAAILVTILTAAPVAYFRGSATVPLGLSGTMKSTTLEPVEQINHAEK